jgi:hypothetical protein
MTGSMDIADIKDVSIFATHVGSLFQVEVAHGQFAEIKLVEAEALKRGSTSSDGQSRQPFALLFDVQGDVDLQQQIYAVRHDQLGELPLFLVSVGSGRMESVFN